MACCDRRLSLGAAKSVRPTYLATVPVERSAEGGIVYLRKTCADHGAAFQVAAPRVEAAFADVAAFSSMAKRRLTIKEAAPCAQCC